MRLTACAAACALLTGCISDPFPNAQVDPNSPVAADVAKLSRSDRPFPTFRDIPAIPTDVRPLAQYGQQANGLIATRDRIMAETADNTWTLQDTTGFADTARRAVPDIPPPTAADTEAFTRELRERATPPPPR